mmetsp:Transcript_31498/g.98145  ORF Transcript_31498/g.98145 Transcript_31498/m.98145 type:complete len:226 (-) Transcript_31498:495-1172(-)
MSWPTPITPTTLFWRLRRAVALQRISRRWPALVNKENSKLVISWPWRPCESIACTESAKSSVMKCLRKRFPSASSLGKPVSSSAFRFHSSTHPASSTPMMGALTVRMSFCRSWTASSASIRSRLDCVRSWPMYRAPSSVPSALRRGEAQTRTSYQLSPEERDRARNGCWMWPPRLSPAADERTAASNFMKPARSSLWKASAMLCLDEARPEEPNTSMALLFQSWM